MAAIETLVAIGDSAMWGQGIRHDRKYVTQVYRALSGGDRLPERNVKAHSGAVIGVDQGGPSLRHDYRAEAALTDVEQDEGPIGTRTGRHEKPHSGLTILQQLDRLPYDHFGHDPPADRDLREETDRAYDQVDTSTWSSSTAGSTTWARPPSPPRGRTNTTSRWPRDATVTTT